MKRLLPFGSAEDGNEEQDPISRRRPNDGRGGGRIEGACRMDDWRNSLSFVTWGR